jgi:glyoxylase-like metal-dependent hydrolase (beta-lactamase superfamily II)
VVDGFTLPYYIWKNPASEAEMKLGEIEIFSLVENRFKIDGGAMFGVVPKTIWEKLVNCDGKNRVDLDLNLLLVKTKDKNILIDAGMGETLTDRMKKIYGIEKESELDKGLAMFGLKPEDIDLVILTHLHLDHAGGVVKFNHRGEKVPSFPNARHVIRSQEWKDALVPDERTAATYFPENFLVLENSQLVELVDGEKEIEPGVKVIPTGGHTAGHQAVLIESGNEKVICPGDIIPTRNHLKVPYVASVDTYPLETMKVKKEFLGKCLVHGWNVAFDHDTELKLAKLRETDDKIEIIKVSIQE